MKKNQVLKLWGALAASTSIKDVISAFENRIGYGSKRTLGRFAQAREGFIEGLQSEIIARKTGWRVEYVNKIRPWWEEWVAQKPGESYEKTQYKNEIPELLNNDEISVLGEYSLKLTTGVSEYDIPTPIRTMFQALCLKGIVRVEQRRQSSGPHQYDASYWIYTDHGKDIARRLDIIKARHQLRRSGEQMDSPN